jgi:hypothetical protein
VGKVGYQNRYVIIWGVREGGRGRLRRRRRGGGTYIRATILTRAILAYEAVNYAQKSLASLPLFYSTNVVYATSMLQAVI